MLERREGRHSRSFSDILFSLQLLKSSSKMSLNHNIFPMWAYRVEMKERTVSSHIKKKIPSEWMGIKETA